MPSSLTTIALRAATVVLAGALSVACTSTPAAAPAPAAPTAAPVAEAPTCDGQGVDPAAKIRYRTERVIAASPAAIWAAQTDFASWPQWQQAVLTNERLDAGPLRPGSQFRWTSPVPATPLSPATTLQITSTVQQVEPQQCIRWTGPAEGPGLRIDQGVHVWTFTEVPVGTRVVTEETHSGTQIEQDVPLATHFLGLGLEAWLDNLKTRAEGS